MLGRSLLLLGAAALASVTIACSEGVPSSEPLDQDDLGIDELVARASAGDWETVDDLLGALPEEQLASVVLLEQSGSLHRADVAHPRMVFYGPDARLIVAVSTLPADRRYETVELMELDEDTGAFRLAAITFGDDGVAVEGDGRCTGCHGDEPRPIWGAYPSWPGAFGPLDGELTAEQAAALETMRADASHRFRFAADALSNDYILTSRSYGYPNTVLNYELGPRIAGSIVTRARASARYARFAPALVALPQCGYVDDERVVALAESMRSSIEAEAIGSGGYEWEAIYEIWGLDLARDFAIGSRADRPAAADGAQRALWKVGSAYLDDLVRFLVLEELVASDASLAAPLVAASAARADIAYFGWELRGSERAAALSGEDAYDRAYLDPQARVMEPALGAIDGRSPERVAFCLRLGELWQAANAAR